MNTVQKLSAIAALLFCASGALASSHYVVIPVPGRHAQNTEDLLKVTLNPATLPQAKLGKQYNYDFLPQMTVTGDPELDTTKARFHAESGLPDGLTLQPNGVLTGTPNSFFEDSLGSGMGTSSLQIVATYKNKEGRQVYTLKIGENLLNVTKIAAGAKHACAITDEGAVMCWGDNSQGQLGIGVTGGERLTPVYVADRPLGAGTIAISAGSYHTCAISSDRDLKCWGSSLGNGTGSSRSSPTLVPTFAGNAYAVATGLNHSCAINNNSELSCWGLGNSGQIGNGANVSTNGPASVGTGYSMVDAGGQHTCALSGTTVSCWGANGAGQLGDGTTNIRNRPTPVVTTDFSQGAQAIATGSAFSCAIAVTGQVYCWGQNTVGQLGSGTAGGYVTTPQRINSLSAVFDLQAGTQHACALSNVQPNKVLCWGSNSQGQTGSGGTTQENSPIAVGGFAGNVTQLSAGDQFNCAVTSSGTAKCWGQGSAGQLGNGQKVNVTIPVSVQGD